MLSNAQDNQDNRQPNRERSGDSPRGPRDKKSFATDIQQPVQTNQVRRSERSEKFEPLALSDQQRDVVETISKAMLYGNTVEELLSPDIAVHPAFRDSSVIERLSQTNSTDRLGQINDVWRYTSLQQVAELYPLVLIRRREIETRRLAAEAEVSASSDLNVLREVDTGLFETLRDSKDPRDVRSAIGGFSQATLRRLTAKLLNAKKLNREMKRVANIYIGELGIKEDALRSRIRESIRIRILSHANLASAILETLVGKHMASPLPLEEAPRYEKSRRYHLLALAFSRFEEQRAVFDSIFDRAYHEHMDVMAMPSHLVSFGHIAHRMVVKGTQFSQSNLAFRMGNKSFDEIRLGSFIDDIRRQESFEPLLRIRRLQAGAERRADKIMAGVMDHPRPGSEGGVLQRGSSREEYTPSERRFLLASEHADRAILRIRDLTPTMTSTRGLFPESQRDKINARLASPSEREREIRERLSVDEIESEALKLRKLREKIRDDRLSPREKARAVKAEQSLFFRERNKVQRGRRAAAAVFGNTSLSSGAPEDEARDTPDEDVFEDAVEYEDLLDDVFTDINDDRLSDALLEEQLFLSERTKQRQRAYEQYVVSEELYAFNKELIKDPQLGDSIQKNLRFIDAAKEEGRVGSVEPKIPMTASPITRYLLSDHIDIDTVSKDAEESLKHSPNDFYAYSLAFQQQSFQQQRALFEKKGLLQHQRGHSAEHYLATLDDPQKGPPQVSETGLPPVLGPKLTEGILDTARMVAFDPASAARVAYGERVRGGAPNGGLVTAFFASESPPLPDPTEMSMEELEADAAKPRYSMFGEMYEEDMSPEVVDQLLVDAMARQIAWRRLVARSLLEDDDLPLESLLYETERYRLEYGTASINTAELAAEARMRRFASDSFSTLSTPAKGEGEGEGLKSGFPFGRAGSFLADLLSGEFSYGSRTMQGIEQRMGGVFANRGFGMLARSVSYIGTKLLHVAIGGVFLYYTQGTFLESSPYLVMAASQITNAVYNIPGLNRDNYPPIDGEVLQSNIKEAKRSMEDARASYLRMISPENRRGDETSNIGYRTTDAVALSGQLLFIAQTVQQRYPRQFQIESRINDLLDGFDHIAKIFNGTATAEQERNFAENLTTYLKGTLRLAEYLADQLGTVVDQEPQILTSDTAQNTIRLARKLIGDAPPTSIKSKEIIENVDKYTKPIAARLLNTSLTSEDITMISSRIGQISGSVETYSKIVNEDLETLAEKGSQGVNFASFVRNAVVLMQERYSDRAQQSDRADEKLEEVLIRTEKYRANNNVRSIRTRMTDLMAFVSLAGSSASSKGSPARTFSAFGELYDVDLSSSQASSQSSFGRGVFEPSSSSPGESSVPQPLFGTNTSSIDSPGNDFQFDFEKAIQMGKETRILTDAKIAEDVSRIVDSNNSNELTLFNVAKNVVFSLFSVDNTKISSSDLDRIRGDPEKKALFAAFDRALAKLPGVDNTSPDYYREFISSLFDDCYSSVKATIPMNGNFRNNTAFSVTMYDPGDRLRDKTDTTGINMVVGEMGVLQVLETSERARISSLEATEAGRKAPYFDPTKEVLPENMQAFREIAEEADAKRQEELDAIFTPSGFVSQFFKPENIPIIISKLSYGSILSSLVTKIANGVAGRPLERTSDAEAGEVDRNLGNLLSYIYSGAVSSNFVANLQAGPTRTLMVPMVANVITIGLTVVASYVSIPNLAGWFGSKSAIVIAAAGLVAFTALPFFSQFFRKIYLLAFKTVGGIFAVASPSAVVAFTLAALSNYFDMGYTISQLLIDYTLTSTITQLAFGMVNSSVKTLRYMGRTVILEDSIYRLIQSVRFFNTPKEQRISSLEPSTSPKETDDSTVGPTQSPFLEYMGAERLAIILVQMAADRIFYNKGTISKETIQTSSSPEEKIKSTIKVSPGVNTAQINKDELVRLLDSALGDVPGVDKQIIRTESSSPLAQNTYGRRRVLITSIARIQARRTPAPALVAIFQKLLYVLLRPKDAMERVEALLPVQNEPAPTGNRRRRKSKPTPPVPLYVGQSPAQEDGANDTINPANTLFMSLLKAVVDKESEERISVPYNVKFNIGEVTKDLLSKKQGRMRIAETLTFNSDANDLFTRPSTRHLGVTAVASGLLSNILLGFGVRTGADRFMGGITYELYNEIDKNMLSPPNPNPFDERAGRFTTAIVKDYLIGNSQDSQNQENKQEDFMSMYDAVLIANALHIGNIRQQTMLSAARFAFLLAGTIGFDIPESVQSYMSLFPQYSKIFIRYNMELIKGTIDPDSLNLSIYSLPPLFSVFKEALTGDIDAESLRRASHAFLYAPPFNYILSYLSGK